MTRTIELTEAEISHLILLLNNNEREEWYYPPRERWWKSHASLKDKLTVVPDKTSPEGVSVRP